MKRAKCPRRPKGPKRVRKSCVKTVKLLCFYRTALTLNPFKIYFCVAPKVFCVSAKSLSRHCYSRKKQFVFSFFVSVKSFCCSRLRPTFFGAKIFFEQKQVKFGPDLRLDANSGPARLGKLRVCCVYCSLTRWNVQFSSYKAVIWVVGRCGPR